MVVVEQTQPSHLVQRLFRRICGAGHRLAHVLNGIQVGGQEGPRPAGPGRACRPRQADVVANHAQLHKHVPSLAVSLPTERAPHEGLNALQAVQLLVAKRVAIGVPVVATPPHLHGRQRLEGFVRRHHAHPTSVQERGRPPLPCQHDVARVPAELVMPRIVVRSRRHKSTAVGRERHHGAAGFPNLVDDLHRAHVVDARVQPHFVQHQNSFFLRLGIQSLHVVGHVTGRQHVHPRLDGHTRHLGMHERREHADDQIRRRNAGVAVRGV